MSAQERRGIKTEFGKVGKFVEDRASEMVTIARFYREVFYFSSDPGRTARSEAYLHAYMLSEIEKYGIGVDDYGNRNFRATINRIATLGMHPEATDNEIEKHVRLVYGSASEELVHFAQFRHVGPGVRNTVCEKAKDLLNQGVKSAGVDREWLDGFMAEIDGVARFQDPGMKKEEKQERNERLKDFFRQYREHPPRAKSDSL